MIKMIEEMRILKFNKTPENWKKYHKLFMKASKLYAEFYGVDLATGMQAVNSMI